jgi:hypothetical protein
MRGIAIPKGIDKVFKKIFLYFIFLFSLKLKKKKKKKKKRKKKKSSTFNHFFFFFFNLSFRKCRNHMAFLVILVQFQL